LLVFNPLFLVIPIGSFNGLTKRIEQSSALIKELKIYDGESFSVFGLQSKMNNWFAGHDYLFVIKDN
jgi:hypothetical protein